MEEKRDGLPRRAINTLSRIISVANDKFHNRRVKAHVTGPDIRNSYMGSLPGVDSNPIPNMRCMHTTSIDMGVSMFFGFIVKNQITEPGEVRLFSVNTDNEEQTSIYVKGDGTIEIGGNADYAVKYNELKSAFDELRDDHNSLVESYNALRDNFQAHIHPFVGLAVGAPGSTSATATTATPSTPSSVDMSSSKAENIKIS